MLESAYEWPRVYTTGQVAASCFLRSEDARVMYVHPIQGPSYQADIPSRAHSDNLPAQAALPSPPFLTEANAVDVADKGRAYVTPPSAGHRDLFHPSYYLPVQPPRYGDVQTSVTYLPLPDEDVKLEVQSREPSPPSIRAARLRPTDTWRPARPAQLTNDTNEAGPSRQLLRRELLGDDASIEEEKQDDDMAQRQVRGTHDAAEHREQQQRDADGHPRADRTSLERPMSNRGPGVALGTVADRAEQKAARDAAGAEEEHIDVRRLYGREDAAWWNDMAYAQRQPTALRTENGLTLSVYLADGCRSCTK